MVLTEIGEIGVYTEGKVHILRPSLYAMSRLGDPVEIVETFGQVMGAPRNEKAARLQLQSALAVIACCTDDDVSDVFGHWGEEDFVPGGAPIEHIFPIARCLLKHGITGALPDLPRKEGEEPEYVRAFDARAHVALAVAHLGSSELEAWSMTMTSLVGALRAKFPRAVSDSPGARAPTKEQHEATMEWFDKIEAKRLKRSGSH